MRKFSTLIRNNKWLGYGIEIGREGGPMHLSMASGLFLQASCQSRHEKSIEKSLDQLLNDKVFKATNGWGWGLGWEFDAFGKHRSDPSIPINPSDTIYGVTTAICINSILSAFKIYENQNLLKVALSSLDAYIQHQCTERGFFPYSNLTEEKHFVVNNITACFLRPLIQAFSITNDQFYLECAIAAYKSLLKNRAEMSNSISSEKQFAWNYCENPPMQGKSRLNDLIHHSFICDGLIALRYDLDDKSKKLFPLLDDTLDGSICHLDAFFFDDLSAFSELPVQRSATYKSPRCWALAMAGVVFARLNNKDRVKQIWKQIKSYEVDFCKYENNLNARDISPRVVSFVAYMQSTLELIN